MTVLRAPVLAVAAVTLTLGGCGSNPIPTQEEAARAQRAAADTHHPRTAAPIPHLVAPAPPAARTDSETLTTDIPTRQPTPPLNTHDAAPPDPTPAQKDHCANVCN